MKVVVQRVKSANCVVNGVVVSSTKHGYMLLVSFTHSDTIEEVKKMARKVAYLRVFEDDFNKLNKSIIDVNGEILSISQFTLYANPYTGNRPSFTDCMYHKIAIGLYEEFNKILNEEYKIKTLPGVFGEDMELNVKCDGPVTINLEF